jgi:tRNA pseudouridine32 synthase/23S rRNA pseudouridine746 synthase
MNEELTIELMSRTILTLHSWNFVAGKRIYSPPENEGLKIVYEDEHLIALDKPHGLLSVPGKGEDKADCLASRVREQIPNALIVHRLDMETSGVMMMAKSKELQRRLGMLFEKRKVRKRYIAVVKGWLEPVQGTIDLPIMVDWPNKPRQKVDFVQGKPSRTDFERLVYDEETHTTRVALYPHSGRSHQLRLHLHALGHSIVGDRIYSVEPPAENQGRLMLHAQSLGFEHPVNGEFIWLQAPANF